MKILTIAFALYSVTATAQQLNIDSIYVVAEVAFKNERYDSAIHLYSIIIQSDSSNRLAIRQRGRAKVFQGKYGEGIIDLTKAISMFPRDTFAYYNRGFAFHFLDNNYKAAIKDYSMAISLYPNGEYYTWRALAYEGLQKYQKALRDFDTAVQLNPSWWVINSRGTYYLRMENYSKAVKDFNAVIELYPKYASAYEYRARCKANQNDRKGACDDIQKAIELGGKVSDDLVKRYCK